MYMQLSALNSKEEKNHLNNEIYKKMFKNIRRFSEFVTPIAS